MLQVREHTEPSYQSFKSWNDMGRVYVEIELVNHDDMVRAKDGHIGPDKVRKKIVTFMVDSGADYLCINEAIQQELQLSVLESPTFTVADGSKKQMDIVGPVDFFFQNRRGTADAVVLPGDSVPLLGAIPMEIMDVVIHPKSQTLTVNPDSPSVASHYLKGFK